MASDEYSLSEKIDNEMELFRKNIDKYKAEVTRITEEMKQLIDKKSDELLKELDDILKEVYEKKKKQIEVDQNFEKIQEHQKAMEDILSKMNPSFTLMTEVSERIETIKKEIDTELPDVKLIWKMDALKDSINNMCNCEVEAVPTQRKLASDRAYGISTTDEIGSENQVAKIQNLLYQEPLQVVTEYGLFEGYFKGIIDFQGQLHVGVELEKVPPGPPSFWKTPDGVHYDQRLFDCRPGCGALVPINKCRVQGYPQPQQMTVSEESTLHGLPNQFKVDPPMFSINDLYDRKVESVPDTPVTPKPALRVIAYFEVNGRDVMISGSILTTLSAKSGETYYELRTDKPVHFQIRDKEIKLKAPRTTVIDNSLFVTSDQCEDLEHQGPLPTPLPLNHPFAHSGADSIQKKTKFILGDLITLPLEGADGLISGTVGYLGTYKGRAVVELCASPHEYKSAFIRSLRNKYEVVDLPDHLRHHDMKGFSLVVNAKWVIPHDGSSFPP